MNNKTLIYHKLVELNDPNGLDTQTLANILGMSRSNVSHELNKLYKQGKIKKTSGRPVLFYVENTSSPTKTVSTQLDELAKHNTSLKEATNQAKAAILYPPKGLATLILGDTGVGKSMFVSLMHSYAIEMDVIEEEAPFIVFNCADYSNNPQLLVSQLFGVKKGTYTGAEFDRVGLIEKADGGILFLDEVHRLPPEGQEALFTYLDTNTFRRIGDSELRNTSALIITATTENPDSALLETFTRRIPMVFRIPSLKQRTFDERLYLIKSFFKQESIKLNRDIYVSCNTIRALLSYECKGNIGQLKSDIQLICAKAYSEFLTNVRQDLRISSRSLPTHIREGLLKEKEHRMIWHKLTGEEIEYFRFAPNMKTDIPTIEEEDNHIYSFIENKLAQLQARGISEVNIDQVLAKDIMAHFQKYLNLEDEKANKSEIKNLLGKDTMDCVDKVISYVSSKLGKDFNNNLYTALALHIDTLIKRIRSKKNIINPQLLNIRATYPKEYKVALEAKNIISEHIREDISDDEAGYLTIFLLPEYVQTAQNDQVKIIVIAHGASTATSMVNVVNGLLKEEYAIALDAPLDESPSKIYEKLKTIVLEDNHATGYLLLVDMGSLTTFSEMIEEELKIPCKSIPLVSTLHVIEATRKALLGTPLDHIYNDVLQVQSYISDRISPDSSVEKRRIAIITTCLTGEGGSLAIKNILKNQLKYDKNLFEIIPINSLNQGEFMKTLSKMQLEREILFIISSFPISTPIKHYSMYDVVSMSVIDELQEIIDIRTTLIRLPMVLKENIQNLDGEKLYGDVREYIENVLEKTNTKLGDSNIIGLILHLAFMISRLKDHKTTLDYSNKSEVIISNKKLYEIIKKQFFFLGEKYNISLSDNEICYLIEYFKQ